MENSVVVPVTAVKGEDEEKIRQEIASASSSVVNEECESSVNFVLTQNVSLSPSTTSLLCSLTETEETTTNINQLGCTQTSSEATRFTAEIKKLSGKLVLGVQKIVEQKTEVKAAQNAKLVEATGLIAAPVRQLDKGLGFPVGQEMEGVGSKKEGSLDALSELKNLVAQERKQRLEAEEKLAQLKNSVKSMNEEYSQFFEDVKEHLIEGGLGNISSSKERLDQLSKFVQVRFEKHVVEQLALKTTVKEMNQVIQGLIEVISSQNFKESTIPAPAPPAQRNYDTLKTKPNPKVVSPAQPIKVIQKEVNRIGTKEKAPPKKLAGKLEKATTEHAEDTSKSHLKGFYCICGVEYTTKSNLTIHIRSLTEEGKFKCRICKEKFLQFYVLRRHLESKHKIKQTKGNGAHCIGCMECGKTFASMVHLKEHRRLVHSQESTGNVGNPRIVAPKTLKVTGETISISGKKHGMNIGRRHQGFYCICGIKFINRKSLDGHIRFQNKGTSSEIPVSKFSIEHKVIPSKPLQCICGFRSTNKHFTTKHVMYYTTERKFKCDVCPKRFLNMAYLREHYKTSHKLSKDIALGNGCRKCGLSFENMKEFREHSKTVHKFGWDTRNSMKRECESAEVNVSLTSPSSLATGSPRRGLRNKNARGNLNEQDDNEDLTLRSPPVSPQPIPIPIYFDDDEEVDQEMLTMPQVKSTAASLLPVRQEVDDDEEEDMEVQSPSDTFAEVHERDTARRSKFFYCTCGPRFTSKKGLGAHIKQKTEKWNFQCNICKKLFFYNSVLKRHMLKSHPNVDGGSLEDENVGSVDSESKSAADVPSLTSDEDNDNDEHSSPSTPVVAKSPKLTSSNEEQTHGCDIKKQKLGLFYCICGKNCVDEIRLQSHITYSKRELKFPCDICGSRFAFLSVFRRHLEQTHNIKGDSHSTDSTTAYKFPCTVCEKGFFYKSELARHIQRKHKNEGGTGVEETSSSSKVKRQCECGKCGRKFNTQMELLQHNKLFHKTTGLREAVKSRKRKNKVIKGNSTHHQISPGSSSDNFKCACGLTYLQRCSLRKHIVKQSRGSIFKCSLCPRAFTDGYSLRNHTKKAHEIDLGHKRYGCGLCGELFQNLDDRKRHRNRVHGGRK